jgi:hypothetical protein
MSIIIAGVFDRTPGPVVHLRQPSKAAMRPRRSEHPVAGAPWGIGPLQTCYGNPGGADATADAVLETSAATETLCPDRPNRPRRLQPVSVR